MLRLGSASTEDDHQASTPPVMTAPSSHTETTHVPDPSDQEASPAGSHPVGGDRAALEVGAKGQPSSGPAATGEDRRRGRPEWAARDQGGPAGSEDGAAMAEEVCARERLKRHRVAMAGRVWIPDTWGQESLLKDWVDCSAVGRALVPSGVVSAREALVEEYRRAEPGNCFRLESSCLST